MPFGEEVVLGLIVAVFAFFAVLLLTLSWLDHQYEKSLKGSSREAAEPRFSGHPGQITSGRPA
jgi:hypothetical protein